MSDTARAWLAARAGAVPPELAAEMERAVAEVSDEQPLHAALAEAARGCLRRALQFGDERAAALPLLAADALVTCACEAAAVEGADALTALAHSLAPERLADFIPSASAE